MKLIIAGSRKFCDYAVLERVCDILIFDVLKLEDDIEIVSGMAVGADMLGYKYAKDRGIKVTSDRKSVV